MALAMMMESFFKNLKGVVLKWCPTFKVERGLSQWHFNTIEKNCDEKKWGMSKNLSFFGHHLWMTPSRLQVFAQKPE